MTEVALVVGVDVIQVVLPGGDGDVAQDAGVGVVRSLLLGVAPEGLGRRPARPARHALVNPDQGVVHFGVKVLQHVGSLVNLAGWFWLPGSSIFVTIFVTSVNIWKVAPWQLFVGRKRGWEGDAKSRNFLLQRRP